MERIDNYQWFKADRDAHNETKDCVVVSIATAFDVPYTDAMVFCRAFLGRKHRKGTPYRNSIRIDRFAPAGSIEPMRFKIDGRKKNITVGKFCERYPKGRFILMVNGHCLSVIDGVCYDHTDKPRRHVEIAYRVTGTLNGEHRVQGRFAA